MKGHFTKSLKQLRTDVEKMITLEDINESEREVDNMKCIKGYEVQPLKSGAGWYLGTLDEDGLPNCRISTSYAKTKEEAEHLPMNRQTSCIENEYCNGGKGCFGCKGGIPWLS